VPTPAQLEHQVPSEIESSLDVSQSNRSQEASFSAFIDVRHKASGTALLTGFAARTVDKISTTISGIPCIIRSYSLPVCPVLPVVGIYGIPGVHPFKSPASGSSDWRIARDTGACSSSALRIHSERSAVENSAFTSV